MNSAVVRQGSGGFGSTDQANIFAATRGKFGV
jgi:hypothetical protein